MKYNTSNQNNSKKLINNSLRTVKYNLLILIFIVSVLALVASIGYPTNNMNDSILISQEPIPEFSFNEEKGVFDNYDPFGQVYDDFGINPGDLFNAFNSKPTILPEPQLPNKWVDDFNGRTLNGRWANYLNGSTYEVENGKLTNHITKNDTISTYAFSMLELENPVTSGDFEAEIKLDLEPTAYTENFFIVYTNFEDNNLNPNSATWTPPYVYIRYVTTASVETNNLHSSLGGGYISISNSSLLSGLYLKINYTSNTKTFALYHKNGTSDWTPLGPTSTAYTFEQFKIGLFSRSADPAETKNVSVDYFSLISDQEIQLLETLRDNENDYQQVWEPWVTKAAVHKAAVSDSGDLLVVAGGFLLDTELHIYRWDYVKRQYVKAFEAGSGIIQGDVYDLTFGDSDNNRLIEIAAASADGHVYLFEQNHLYDPNTNLESKFDLVWQSGNELQQQVSTVDFYDVDLDYIQDLIVGSYDRKIHIYEYYNHTGYPFASTEHKIDLAEKWVSQELDDAVMSVVAGDFNNNGLPDFVVGTRSGTIYIFENAGLVVDVRGTPTLLPWDNNYKLIQEFTGDERPIWYPITKIEAGQLDGKGGTDAVLLAWGQGTFVLNYDENKGEFVLEQIVKKFADWEQKLPYPLDNYADWIEVNSTQNVWHNITGTVVYEPICCDVEFNVNGASGYVPDGKYSHFTPTSNLNATAIYALWEGELLATSANSDPDLYIIMYKNQAVQKSNWAVSVSQDKDHWFDVESSQLSTTLGATGRSLAIDLDPTFAKEKITSIKYIKITLAPGSSEQQVDALFYPRAYRPLTTTTAAMIRPLKVSVSDTITDNKITFGTVDGRFLAYKYEATMSKFKFSTFNGYELYTNYRVTIPKYLEVWDSYEDDNFNLKTTIWDIHYTPKERYIPSWRFDDSTGTEFVQADVASWEGTSTTRVHSFDIERIYPYASDAEIVVTTNNSVITDDKIILLSNTNGQRAKLANDFDLSAYFLDPINVYYFNSARLLTHTFGDITSAYGNELLVFPWYQDGRPFLTGNAPSYGSYIEPRIFSRGAYNLPFSSSVAITSYMSGSELTNFQTFIASATTFPSGTFADLDNDGLNDIIISNGNLAVLWNRGTTTTPEFYFDDAYFSVINSDLVDNTTFQPQAWDYDLDGDMDIAFSYGRSSGDAIYGFDFFDLVDINSRGDVFWERNIQIIENPSRYGSLISNKYTLGIIKPSTSCETATIFESCTSAESFWVYSPYQDPGNGYYERLRKLTPDVTSQTSFIVGTNPYVMKIEANRFNEYPDSINMGYSLTTSWSNKDQISEWTRAVTTGDLDNDGKREVIVGDYDNNIYVFEHLSNNTYKRAFKSHNLNHTEKTDLSPYLWEELAGISGNFTRIVYDHTNFMATGVDFNNDGLNGFVATSGNTIYVFESTGYNDETILFLQFDIGNLYEGIAGFDQSVEKITALAVSKDFDGRGSIIAAAINNKLFMFRLDEKLGLVDSFAFYEKGPGYQLPGSPFAYPNLIIQSLMFADMNKDNITELWIGGIDKTSGINGLLVALSADMVGNLYVAYEFSTSFTNGKTINALTTSDADIDDNLELVIAHSLGVDIYEFGSKQVLSALHLDTITSNVAYALSTGVVLSKIDGIENIKAVAVGDTDKDLRSEILISHGLQVSLFEVTQDSNKKLAHKYVWSSDEFKDRPNSIAIDDINGNGWPEIFVAVEGDDVYAFEVIDTDQPKASSNYLTKLNSFSRFNTNGSDVLSYDSIFVAIPSISNNTVIMTDGRTAGGIVAWDTLTNTKLWNVSDPFGAQSQYLHQYEDKVIVVSTGGVYAVDLNNQTILYTKTGNSDFLSSSYLFMNNLLITGYKNTTGKDLIGITALNMGTGSIAWYFDSLVLTESVDNIFDLSVYSKNETTIFTVSVSDLSSFKTFYFFDDLGNLLFNHSSEYVDSSPYSSRSVMGDFDGDTQLDIATATTDLATGENNLIVHQIQSFSILYELNLKEFGGTIYDRIPIFATDFNNDSRNELILTFAQYNASDTSSYFLDSPGYKNGLIVAIDITVPIILWERPVSDSISNIELITYENDPTFMVFTDNLGVLGISDNGADKFWAQGGSYSVSASISDYYLNVSTLNGFFYTSEFKGLLTRADNFVFPRPSLSKSIGTTMFNSDNVLELIPIDLFNKGSDEMLVAFTNGTFKLLNYLSGEIMAVNLSTFSSITAKTLYYDLNKFGFIIGTDNNSLKIFDRTSNEPILSIPTPGKLVGELLTFNLTGEPSDVILIQTEQDYGYMLSIYDLEKDIFIWNRTYANEITTLKVGSFDGTDPDQITHIIALDTNGIAQLIELPNVFLAGGEFINPDLGRWTSLKITVNSNNLTDVYLGSNMGQIFKYTWDLAGSYTISEYNAETIGSGEAPNLHITEIMYSPPSSHPNAEWVELHNPTNKAISLEGWYFTDYVNSNKFFLFGEIPSGGYIVATKDNSQFEALYGFEADFEWKNDAPSMTLDDSNEGILVYDPLDSVIANEYFAWGGPVNVGKYDITAVGSTLVKNTVKDRIAYTNTEFIDSGSLGTPKNGPYFTKLLISEVYYNTKYSDTKDNTEWFEIYNPTGIDVSLNNWILKSARFSWELALSGVIKANDYFVIAKNADAFKELYGFEPDMIFEGIFSFLYDFGDVFTLYNPELVNIDDIGWYNYLGKYNIYTDDQTMRRKTISDTDTASDFEFTGGYGTPGFGHYNRSYNLISVQKQDDSDSKVLTYNTPTNKLIILVDNNSLLNSEESILTRSELRYTYDSSILTNIDGYGLEVAIPIGNMLVIESVSGEDIEIHSFSSEILKVTSWNIDEKNKSVLIVYLVDGKMILIDSVERFAGCYYDSQKCAVNQKPSSVNNLDLFKDQENNGANFNLISEDFLFKEFIMVALVLLPVLSLIGSISMIKRRRNLTKRG